MIIPEFATITHMERVDRDNDAVTTPTEPPRRALPHPNVTEG
ncbi:hypothetical protein ABZV68_10190 [Streptomyces clavifer]|nr:hypothetical protein [Streptomyces sp. ND04-05B]MDX3063181.1 hypothetical protein [Streptomyces sp. ND04-05B]